MPKTEGIIKQIREERSFRTAPACDACGSFVGMYRLDPESNEWKMGEASLFDQLCGACMARAIAAASKRMELNPPIPQKKKAPVCRYCWKKKKLVGVWCRSCRDTYQRHIINQALAKVNAGDELTWEEEQTLAAAPRWPVWKKHFRKVPR